MLAAAQKDANGELRARLNRGIALLSKGLLRRGARALRVRARRGGAPRRAAGLRLRAVEPRRHLASSATSTARRSVHWERAIPLSTRSAIGSPPRGRSRTSRRSGTCSASSITPSTRSRSGDARSAKGSPPGARSHFDVVAARIALDRGRTLDARREIEAAIVKAESAKDADLLGEAHRVAARIALEDGDLARVRRRSTRRAS